MHMGVRAGPDLGGGSACAFAARREAAWRGGCGRRSPFGVLCVRVGVGPELARMRESVGRWCFARLISLGVAEAGGFGGGGAVAPEVEALA